METEEFQAPRDDASLQDPRSNRGRPRTDHDWEPAEAVVCETLDGQVTLWDRAAERMFGYTADELLNQSMLRLIPPERRDEQAWVIGRIAAGNSVRSYYALWRHKDGRPIEVTVSVMPIRDADGVIVGASNVVRSPGGVQHYVWEITRLSRLYTALSAINHAIVRAPTREVLFAEACAGLVEQGGFAAAWIGWFDPESSRLMPVASYGNAEPFLSSVVIYANGTAQGQGPSGTAFCEGRPYICNDFEHDPKVQPWREQLAAKGWRAATALPIRCGGSPCGTLTVYAREAGVFRQREVGLLIEAARDISFALDHFAEETERRRAERAVRKERDFTAALINSLPGVLYAYDQSGRFLRWNDNFERVTGYSGDEIRRMHPIEFIGEADREAVQCRIDEVFATGSSSVEATLRAKDGSLKPYYFTGVRLDISGQAALVGVGIDIAERRRAELAQQAAEEARRDVQAEIARIMRVSALGEFAASMAHEVNQPLAAIVTNGDAARRWLEKQPPDLERARSAIGRITRDATRASDVINGLRGLVTRKPPAYTDLNLNRIISDVLLFMRGTFERSQIILHCEFMPRLPPVLGDSVQLQQVVLNLLGNGVDAMQTVEDRARLLHISTRLTESRSILTTIEDSGTGIPPAAAERLFEHFFTTKLGGTGLGLTIARTIVEAHGGRIRARPGVPFGAIFEFSLPAHEAAL